MHVFFTTIIFCVVHIPLISVASLTITNDTVPQDVQNLHKGLYLYPCHLDNTIERSDRFPMLQFLQGKKFYVASHCEVDQKSQEEFKKYVYGVFTTLVADTVDGATVISLQRVEETLQKKVMEIINERESSVQEGPSSPARGTPTNCPVAKASPSPQEPALKTSWRERNPKTFACCMICLGALGFWGFQKLSDSSTLSASTA